jgi:hypothetical protein
MDKVAQFLDLPPDTRDLRHFIEMGEAETAKAAELARLASEGVRFREGD